MKTNASIYFARAWSRAALFQKFVFDMMSLLDYRVATARNRPVFSSLGLYGIKR
ncbi:MAG: hypothetical protein ACE5GQ_12440 [Nitrospinales bacterium]